MIYSIFNFASSTNTHSFLEYITALSTIMTTIIAAIALYTWKEKKKFETKINFIATLSRLQEELNDFIDDKKLPLVDIKKLEQEKHQKDKVLLNNICERFLTDSKEYNNNLKILKHTIYAMLKPKNRNDFMLNVNKVSSYKYATENYALNLIVGKDNSLLKTSLDFCKAKQKDANDAVEEILILLERL